MPVTLKQTEGAPSSYPAAPSGLSDAAAALATVAWQRIESYIAARYTSRSVAWIVEGCGEWCPPLSPATITTVEVWSRAGEWETVSLDPSPLGGFWLAASGPYRFTGTVGGGDVPASVNEAVRRLAEYLAQDPGDGGATSSRTDVTDIESVSLSRSASWMARALQNSGAADLLRGFRHV